MRKFLTLSTVALVALSMGIGAKAASQETKASLERTVQRDTHKIRALQHRRTYLHRYIRHLRKTTTPIVHQTVPYTSTTSSTTATSSGGWADELRAVGFPESAISTMLYYISRESGGNPNAINPSSGACGLLQLYPCSGGLAWLDPMTNLRLAYQKYQASGFAPWGG